MIVKIIIDIVGVIFIVIISFGGGFVLGIYHEQMKNMQSESEKQEMSAVIRGFNKPKDCYRCPFNNSNLRCSITKGIIDRDDYTCNILCPIEQLPQVESEVSE